MSNSQNKKNEQQNNLCTTLTEQWKKGELEKGKKYWCKLQDGTIEICYLWLQTNHFTYFTGCQSKCLPDEYILEVLTPILSYEETKLIALKIDCICEKIAELAVENRQLKELLKGYKEKLKYCTRETYELQTKIAEVLK